jgi:hypothetical protein
MSKSRTGKARFGQAEEIRPRPIIKHLRANDSYYLISMTICAERMVLRGVAFCQEENNHLSSKMLK